MTGRINGFATCMEKVALPGLICIWYEAHQLDIVMHRFYASLLNKQFYKDLTWLIGFLCQQQKFEESIGLKCQKLPPHGGSVLAMSLAGCVNTG